MLKRGEDPWLQSVAIEAYERSLKQKVLLSLLDNMTEQICQRESESQMSKPASPFTSLSPPYQDDDDLLPSRNERPRGLLGKNEVSFQNSKQVLQNAETLLDDGWIGQEELGGGLAVQDINFGLAQPRVTSPCDVPPKSILKSPKDRSQGKSHTTKSPPMIFSAEESPTERQMPLQEHSSQQQEGSEGLYRLAEKESSPVRAFLDEGGAQENSESNPPSIKIYHVEGEEDEYGWPHPTAYNQGSDSANEGDVTDQKISILETNQHPEIPQLEMASDRQTPENFKLLLKCVRIWKVYTKQEILLREQEKYLYYLGKQGYKTSAPISGREGSREGSGAGSRRSSHRDPEKKLLAKGLQALILNLFQEKADNDFQVDKFRSQRKKKLLHNCFFRWSLIIKKIKNLTYRYEKARVHYLSRMVRHLFTTMKKNAKAKKYAINKFKRKQQYRQKKNLWAGMTMVLDGLREKEEAAYSHFMMACPLKSKCFIVLKKMMKEKKQKRAAIKEALLAARLHDRKKVFEAWVNVAKENRIIRQHFAKVSAKHRTRLRNSLFRAWHDIQVKRVQSAAFARAWLLRRGWQGLLRKIERREKKEMFQRCCGDHLQLVRLRQWFQGWRHQIEKQRRYRFFQLHAFQKMDELRQRQVFKQWFNQIDILKRWRFLNENTDLWFVRKTRRRVFQAWRKQIALKLLYFKVHDQQVAALKERTLSKMITEANIQRGSRYIKAKREHNVKAFFLYFWLKKCVPTKRFQYARQNLLSEHQLVLRRARRLLKLAFLGGLKRYWREAVVAKNMAQASRYFYRLRLMKKAFKAMKKKVLAKAHGKQTGRRHFYHMRRVVFKSWLREYMKKDKANRFFRRLQSKRKHTLFHGIVLLHEENVMLQGKLKAFSTEKQTGLLQAILSQWSAYSKARHAKMIRYESLRQQIYLSMLRKRTMAIWKVFTAVRKVKTQKKKIARQQFRFKYLSRAMRALYRHSRLKLNERRQVERGAFAMKYNCFAALQRYSSNQVKSRLYQLIVVKGLMQRVFGGLQRYKQYRQYYQEKQGELEAMTQFHSKRKFFARLNAHRLQSQFDREATKMVAKIRCRRFLVAWKAALHEALEEGEARQLANELFAKHMLRKLFRACQRDRDERHFKASLLAKQQEFYEFNSKRRAIHRMYRFMSERHFRRIKRDYATKVMGKRIFYAWRKSLSHFKRKRLLRESADLMHNNSIMTKGLRALRDYWEKRKKNRLIIDRFLERAEMSTKVEVLLALYDNIEFKKEQRNLFYAKMTYFAEKRMVQPLEAWKDFVVESRQEEKADRFFKARLAQYHYRKVWDRLLIYKMHSLQKKVERRAVDGWHHKLLLQKSILSLKLSTHDNKRNQNIIQLVQLKQNRRLLGLAFENFKDGLVYNRVDSELKQRAHKFFSHNIFRKCFIGFQMSQYRSQQVEIVQKKARARIIKEKMGLWANKVYWARRLSKFMKILQEENDRRLTAKVFPTLIKETFTLQVFDHLELKRLQSYQQEFINELRRRILMRKIQVSFQRAKEANLKRSIFVELRLYAREQEDHQQAVEQVTEENNAELMQIVFNALKERVVVRKFKAISLNCFVLKSMRKVWCALQHHDLRSKILRSKAEEVKRIQEAKYFWHWRQAFVKEREKNDAHEYIQSTMLFQVLQAWRNYAQRNRVVAAFHREVVLKNKMRNVLHGWKHRIAYDQHLSQVAAEVEKNAKMSQIREHMVAWVESAHESKMEKQMTKFYHIKVYKAVLTAWRDHKDYKNLRRLQVHRIRQRFEQKPELARPLKALRQFLMFKAFNQLAEGASMVREEDHLTDKAHFAYYLKSTKKAFLSLRLNSQFREQKRKALEIQSMFIKRRWLNYLKEGTAYCKARRRHRHKASIFRLIALQKKALIALRLNAHEQY